MKTITKFFSLCLLGLAFPGLSPAQTITKDRAIEWMSSTWDIFGLSDQTLRATLDRPDSAESASASYLDWVDFFVTAQPFLNDLAEAQDQEDYTKALREAMQCAGDQAFGQLTSAAGLDAVVAPAELVATILRLELDVFGALLDEDAFYCQLNLYSQLRDAGNSEQQIAGLPDGGFLDKGPTITKMDDWLFVQTGYLTPQAPNNITPEPFYPLAEEIYLARHNYPSGFDAAVQQIGSEFSKDATAPPPTLAPPTIVAQPASVTRSVGDYAGFSVLATGTGPLLYQWQRNGVDIPGATGASYLAGPVVAGDDGAQYTVRVSNSIGGRTSNPATLTVGGISPTSLKITGVSPSTLTGMPLGQTQLIRVIGTGFTVSSTLTFNDGVNPPYTSRVPAFVSPNELDYNISVGPNQGNWTVMVVDGEQQSNLGYFTVNAPSSSLVGSLVVNIGPQDALAAAAQWEVDGTGYNNSGQVVGYLAPGPHTISFKPLSGYTAPQSFTVNIVANQQTLTNGTYTPLVATTYTLTLNPLGGLGAVSPSPIGTPNGGAFVYGAVSVVGLLATANPGYHFAGWGGDLSGSANPGTVTMDANKTITASFAPGDPNLGTVVVTIQPSQVVTAGAQWKLNGTGWMDSSAAFNTPLLDVPMNYLQFKDVPGWVTPKPFFVAVGGGQTTNVTVTYQLDMTPGLLTVTLLPPAAVAAGAKWHVNGSAYGSGASFR